MTSFKQLYVARRLHFVLIFVFFTLIFLFVGIARNEGDGWTAKTVVFSILIVVSFYGFGVCMINCYGFDIIIHNLQSHLGVNSAKQYIELTPHQVEALCIRRLQTLAIELEEVEKHTQPFDKDRLDARNKFSGAFDFFKGQGFIKGDWNRFFPQPKTQK